MSSADWLAISSGSGVYGIVADGTAPSPPDVMAITAGGELFQNITAGPFKDSRITAWNKQNNNSSNNAFALILRSQDNNFNNPATYLYASVCAFSATQLKINFYVINAGVVNNVIQGTINSVNGNPIQTWQQYQFSAFNSGADILLRFAQWNGATFVPLVDAAVPIASFPAVDAAGTCRFGTWDLGGIGTPFYIDDVNFYSLT
jgi:hypothetical protein